MGTRFKPSSKKVKKDKSINISAISTIVLTAYISLVVANTLPSMVRTEYLNNETLPPVAKLQKTTKLSTASAYNARNNSTQSISISQDNNTNTETKRVKVSSEKNPYPFDKELGVVSLPNFEPYENFEEEEEVHNFTTYAPIEEDFDVSSDSVSISEVTQLAEYYIPEETSTETSTATSVLIETESSETSAEFSIINMNSPILNLTDYEFGLVVCAVQHEVGSSANFFTGYNFDIIQQAMARVIINRIGRSDCADTALGVLTQENQFMSLDSLVNYSSSEPTTCENVTKVLNNTDYFTNEPDLIFEMSWKYNASNSLDFYMSKFSEKAGTEVELVYYAISEENRIIIFAKPV